MKQILRLKRGGFAKCLLTVALALCVTSSYAQKGRVGLGINGYANGFGSNPVSVGVGAQLQFGISNTFRIEPYATYYLVDPSKDDKPQGGDAKEFPRVSAGINLHTFFMRGQRLSAYLIIGAAYANMRTKPYVEPYISNGQTIEPEEFELGEDKFGGNFGSVRKAGCIYAHSFISL